MLSHKTSIFFSITCDANGFLFCLSGHNNDSDKNNYDNCQEITVF